MELGILDEVPLPLILVVDDDADAREVYGMTLRHAGFRTEEVENGAFACEMARLLEPDAVLLDHAMPVMDGQEAARRLRADPRTRDTPLVMMTGYGSATALGRAVRADAACDAYLAKPCKADEIVAALRGVLLSRGDRRIGARPGPTELSP
jgi:two-component system cell cycle response regulator DivK